MIYLIHVNLLDPCIRREFLSSQLSTNYILLVLFFVLGIPGKTLNFVIISVYYSEFIDGITESVANS
jgi:hypothetical protein